jgi:hypothetical protein
MDKRYSAFLESVEKPCFVLVKNLDFEHPSDLDSPISRGEIIAHSEKFEILKKKIPSPKLPEDDYKLSLFEKKFGELKSSVADMMIHPWTFLREIQMIMKYLMNPIRSSGFAGRKRKRLRIIWYSNIRN